MPVWEEGVGTNCVQECAQTNSQSSTGGVSNRAAVIRDLLTVPTGIAGVQLSPSHKVSVAERVADAIMGLSSGGMDRVLRDARTNDRFARAAATMAAFSVPAG